MLIKVTGADKALQALRKMEPLTAREVGREVTGIGQMIVGATTAPDSVMRNWRSTAAGRAYKGSRQGSGGWPAYQIPKARSRRRGMSVTVDHHSAASVIYEYAGVRNPYGRDGRGRSFIQQLPPLTRMSSGPPGRYLRRGLAMTYRRAIDKMEEATNKAVDAVNRLMP
jgi:hypothetical protein